MRSFQLASTCEGYRAAARNQGIRERPNGLFPPADPLLTALAAAPKTFPFEKLVATADGPYLAPPAGGWATGNSAAASGLDLRLFYMEPFKGEDHGSVFGAVRFGDSAAIAQECHLNVHGGAIMSALDEAASEMGKCDFAPVLGTVDASFRMHKAVPVHTSLRVECLITSKRAVRCWVDGRLLSADGETQYASCTIQLVNMMTWVKAEQEIAMEEA
ncbi:hypothetical protein H632_c792p0 [Helicosporidium sp. ATCC 50920]|nr:hypothetical protein H632_c792p0 [Helicosporidium sp. ATCC 50920]|eukprot:KDD75236.1 hypothetical protein H632_c792p0 [Helicosporidium sp. ATCC 50920]